MDVCVRAYAVTHVCSRYMIHKCSMLLNMCVPQCVPVCIHTQHTHTFSVYATNINIYIHIYIHTHTYTRHVQDGPYYRNDRNVRGTPFQWSMPRLDQPDGSVYGVKVCIFMVACVHVYVCMCVYNIYIYIYGHAVCWHIYTYILYYTCKNLHTCKLIPFPWTALHP
jgi:hypothetical protein